MVRYRWKILTVISLSKHQIDAVEKLRSGSILYGGVGSGKSRAALTYYFSKECAGMMTEAGIRTCQITGDSIFDYTIKPLSYPKDLYIITTARKRDTLEWEQECLPFLIRTIVVDSWNNIAKYKGVKDAFFIFDEQRVIGSGLWVKSFLRIAANNNWILLTATPGDSWMDYVPVFIANGFCRNRTEFIRNHVVYDSFSRYPKIERYIGLPTLTKQRDQILVKMPFQKHTVPHHEIRIAEFDRDIYNTVMTRRWNPYEEQPIENISELCYIARKVVNSDRSRLDIIDWLYTWGHPKLIIFYNFDYELEMLLEEGKALGAPTAQWNGHKHEPIPDTNSWLYLVQYFAGAEAWNCVETNAIIFYSQSYSYKTMVQAAGRIDRLNTPFKDLYYYYIRSQSTIDQAIAKALRNKQTFNEKDFVNF